MAVAFTRGQCDRKEGINMIEKSQWRHRGAIRNRDGRNRSAIYMQEHFKNNGYSTIRLDKVYHIGDNVPEGWDIDEEPFKNADGSNRPLSQSRELQALGLEDNVRRDLRFTEMKGEKSRVQEMAPHDEDGVPITADRLTDGITKLRALEVLDDLATPGCLNGILTGKGPRHLHPSPCISQPAVNRLWWIKRAMWGGGRKSALSRWERTAR